MKTIHANPVYAPVFRDHIAAMLMARNSPHSIETLFGIFEVVASDAVPIGEIHLYNANGQFLTAIITSPKGHTLQ
jgi:hypothetical protein